MAFQFGLRVSWILIGLLCGCAGEMFTEADREQTKTVDQGSTFRIALPSMQDWADPVLKGAGVAFLQREAEESAGTMVFRFQAKREGESEIVIPARPALGEDLNFRMRVMVIEPVDEGDAAAPDDWEESWGRHRRGRDD